MRPEWRTPARPRVAAVAPGSVALPIEPVAEDGDAGWLLSFADLVMLLLTVFVLLFAYSRVPAPKPHPTRALPVRPATAASPKAQAPAHSVARSRPHAAPPPAPVRPAPAPAKPRVAPKAAAARSPAATATAPVHRAAKRTHVPPPARLVPALDWQPPHAAPLILRPAPEPRVPLAPPAPVQTAAIPAPSARAGSTSPHSPTRPQPVPARASNPAAPAAHPAPIILPQDLRHQVQIVRTPGAINLILTDDLLYPAGDAQLSPAGRAVLDRIAALLARNRYAVSVQGYTDDTPIHTARYPSNWELSAARATTVARYLIARGVAPDRLSAVGYGDTRPRASNATPAGRAQNRRVTLVLHLHRSAPIARSSSKGPCESSGNCRK